MVKTFGLEVWKRSTKHNVWVAYNTSELLIPH